MTKVDLGCFYLESAFTIIQHRYAGAPMGYMAGLEVKDPPDVRQQLVLVYYNGNTNTYAFVEFESVEDLEREVGRLQWGRNFRDNKGRIANNPERHYKNQDGFMRFVQLEPGQKPWFFASDKSLVHEGVDFVEEEASA